jgi:charged multivesicular body protein 6
MKVQRDKLQQYQKKITVITIREKEVARECLRRGDKRRALLALRRKKYQETLLANTDKQLEQLEMLVLDVEFSRVQKDVLYGLKQGTMVLKQMQKEMGGIDQVEKLLAEGEEAKAYQKVSRSWTFADAT